MLRQTCKPTHRFPGLRKALSAAAEGSATAELLDDIDPMAGTHALVVGESTLEVMCALIRRGCAEAAELRLEDRPEAQSADLVLAPHVTTLDNARQAAAQARWALLPGGRVRLRIVSGTPGQVGLGAARLLAQ